MLVEIILEALLGDDVPPERHIFEQTYKYIRRVKKWQKKHYYTTIKRMKKRGLITVHEENGKKFIQCTKDGQLYLLFKKAIIPQQGRWDGCWRLVSFDIPESSKEKRSIIRFLLKKNKFTKLQASVYISPYPINREAVEYLKLSGLRNYIRFLKVSEVDDDTDLRKKFKL